MKLCTAAMFTLFSFLTFGSTCHAGPKDKNKTYFYQPTIVELNGVMRSKVFPGRPNYYSIKEGDEAEGGWYLELAKKIDVVVKNHKRSKAFDNQNEKNVKLIQMVIDWWSPNIKKIKSHFRDGIPVSVKGTLFSAITGHHHTPVVFDVDEMKIK